MNRRKEFIAEKKGHHATTFELCSVVGVSESSWYRWQRAAEQQWAQAEGDQALGDLIEYIWLESDKTYGSPRMTKSLWENWGLRINHKRARRLMRERGMYSHSHRHYVKTTIPGSTNAPDLVDRLFFATNPDELWVTDITYIRTEEGWLYLSAIMDMATRKIVGYAMADHLRTELPLAALKQAIKARKPAPGLIHHSDRGTQYTALKYQNKLMDAEIRQSMGATGICFDNAPAEALWASLKKEAINRRRWETRRQAVRAVNTWIRWYNSQRLHSALGYRSPEVFEALIAA